MLVDSELGISGRGVGGNGHGPGDLEAPDARIVKAPVRPAEPTHRERIFVDCENVGGADLAVLDGHPVDVTLVLGCRQGLTVAVVEAVRRLPLDQVTLVQSTLAGRNALDFVLACQVGRAVERYPGSAIRIISRDKGFDALVAHLKTQGVVVARHDSVRGVPMLAGSGKPPGTPSLNGHAAPALSGRYELAATTDPEELESLATFVVDCLERAKPSRPRKRATLVKFIKTQLKSMQPNASFTPQQIIQQLIAKGAILPVGSARLRYADEPPDESSQAAISNFRTADLYEDQMPF
ncbi:MAG: PIN domain-containing protein [Verrucomicrobiales bacterium]